MTRTDSNSSAPDETALRLAGISAGYGDTTVVHLAGFELARGETLSLLGPSGCGKTTLLRTIAGLHPPSAGTLEIAGELVACVNEGKVKSFVPPDERDIGMVFQDGALFPHLSVMNNVLYGLRKHPNPAERAREALNLVDMYRYSDRLPGTLSGGQRQRVALARALAPEPAILLLDEPFSALDAGLRVQLRRDVKQILSDVGITVVVVTHDQEEAFILGDRVAVMHEGRIIQIDTPRTLYTNPATAWIASFVGEANVLSGTFSNGYVDTDLGRIKSTPGNGPLTEGGLAEILLRPEHLELIAEGESTVMAVEYFGHDIRYEVRLPSDRSIGVRTTLGGFGIGDLVSVRFLDNQAWTWPVV